MLKKQILHAKTHPIFLICKIFREKFGAAYKKYVQPSKTESGVVDRVGLIKRFKEKSKALQQRFSRKIEDQKASESYMDADDAEEGEESVKVDEINLTNQLIGEV